MGSRDQASDFETATTHVWGPVGRVGARATQRGVCGDSCFSAQHRAALRAHCPSSQLRSSLPPEKLETNSNS